ncbi:MAG TPA: hypothetical protein VFW14_09695 [Gaiellales bacterium]|nr:hypothetical protein [Gaiellales bacterium]
MVISAKVLGARLQRGEFSEDRTALAVKLGQTLRRLRQVGIHRQGGYTRWRAWCDAELPISGRMADRYIRVATEWERGARGTSLREVAGEAPAERVSVGEVTTRVLTDDDFVTSLVTDDDAWQRLASIRDMMKRKTNRPPSKPTPVLTDLHRARKALYLATRKAERLTARALAGQVALDRELADRLHRAMQDMSSHYGALDDAVQALAATAANLWR